MKNTIQNDDTALWQRVKQHDRLAYEALYIQYLEVIFIKVQQMVQHKADAEDLVQDLFLSIWERRADINLEGRFFSYLYRAAQNKVLNYFRDKKIPSKHLAAWDDLAEEARLPAEDPQTFRVAELKELEYLLEEEKQKLPQKMRRVYELHYEDNLSADEISGRLIISPHTVRNHLKEVRRRFIGAVKKATFFLW